eukprot:symbB.v1.2.020154.t1/scaffold1679.1/size106129/2
MPSLEVIRELGRRLYDRISVIAADRLKLMSQHNDETRAMLIKAIKDRQAKMERVASLEVDEVAQAAADGDDWRVFGTMEDFA